MPSNIRPDDWDRLFAPNAPRRGGPLSTLISSVVILVLLVVIVIGGQFVLNLRRQQVATATTNATLIAGTVQAQQSATAESGGTLNAANTATAPQLTPAARIGTSTVASGGNLRREPLVSPNTIVGLVWPGDAVDLLEQRDVAGQVWYRVRVTQLGANRGDGGVPAATEGWAAASLLGAVQP